MGATLLAIYKRPEGGDDAVATFWQRYREEHMPLIDRFRACAAPRSITFRGPTRVTS
jgi:hypothetical protein